MFEKEARESFKKRYPNNSAINSYYVEGFEDGYNKSNEWHFVENGDLPKEGEGDVWVLFENGNPGIGSFTTGRRWNCADYGNGENAVVAWKEIILPKGGEKNEYKSFLKHDEKPSFVKRCKAFETCDSRIHKDCKGCNVWNYLYDIKALQKWCKEHGKDFMLFTIEMHKKLKKSEKLNSSQQKN